MLSISNVGGGMLQSYYQKDNYYQKGDHLENNQTWQGKLSEHYEVSGEISQEDFFKIYDEKKERAAFDLTFSAPKSVSIIMTMDEFSDDMHLAHDEAVSYVLDEIEKYDVGYRKKRKGISKYFQSDNMLVAKIKHDLSRTLDMQLHTHCLILNKTKCEDGKFRALDNRNLFVNKILRGQQYRNRLALNLMKKGYEIEITNPEKGFFEIDGIDKDMINAFSKSTAKKIHYANSKGIDIHDPKKMADVVKRIRVSKSKLNIEGYKEEWELQKKELGISSGLIEKSDYSTVEHVDSNDFKNYLSQSMGEMKIGFSEKEFLLKGLREGIEYGYSLDNIKLFLQEEIVQKRILATTKREYSGANKNFIQRKYFATSDSVSKEQGIFEMLKESKGLESGLDIYKSELYLVKRKQEGLKLTDDQQDAIVYCSTSNDRYSLINGVAGSGKTTMVKELAGLYESYGYDVRGMGFTGQATKELSDVGIKSKTINSFFIEMGNEAGTFNGDPLDIDGFDFRELPSSNRKEIWLVDESSFINNKIFEKFLEVAEKKKAKVHFLGDVQQLPGIGAGNSFANMINENVIDHVNMKENIRQRNADQKIQDGIGETYDKNINDALNSFDGYISEFSDRRYRIQKLARDFGSQSFDEIRGSFIFTGQNSDRVKINDEVRKVMKENFKLLGGELFEVSDVKKEKKYIELSRKDRVIFLKSDKNLGVLNGTRGTVIGALSGEIIVEVDQGETILIDPKKYNYLDYAYCTTVHKAQGATGDHKAFLHIDTAQSSVNSLELWTVAVTRSKKDLAIYVDDKEGLLDVISRSGLQMSSSEFAKQLERKQSVKYDKKLADMLLDLKKKILAITILPISERLGWDRFMKNEKRNKEVGFSSEELSSFAEKIRTTSKHVPSFNIGSLDKIKQDQIFKYLQNKKVVALDIPKCNRGELVFSSGLKAEMSKTRYEKSVYEGRFKVDIHGEISCDGLPGHVTMNVADVVVFKSLDYNEELANTYKALEERLEKIDAFLKKEDNFHFEDWRLNDFQQDWLSQQLEKKGHNPELLISLRSPRVEPEYVPEKSHDFDHGMGGM